MCQRGVPRNGDDEVVAGTGLCTRQGRGAQVTAFEVAITVDLGTEAGDIGDGRWIWKIVFLTLHEVGPYLGDVAGYGVGYDGGEE